MEYLLSSLYTFTFVLLIRKIPFFQVEGIPKNFVSALFLVKVCFGMTLGLIYTYYYTDRATADIFKYFDDSKVMYDALYTNPPDFFRMLFGIMNDNDYFSEMYYSKMNHWFRPFGSSYNNDTHFIIRFNAAVRLFSFGYFQVHTVFMNVISLAGIIALFRSFSAFTGATSRIFFTGLAILPSLLFWGSGVLKEGWLLFALGFFCMAYFNLLHKRFSLPYLFVLVIMAFILLRLKFYILVALAAPLVAYWWVYKSGNTKILLKYTVTIALLLGMSLNIKYVFPSYDILNMIAQKQKDFICLAEYMNSGSTIDIPRLEPTTISFMSQVPGSMFNGFLRPFPWESNSLLMLAGAMENTFLIVLLVLSISIFRRKSEVNWNLIALSAFFIVILNTIIGMTTPVLGAVVRYKLPCLPFMVLIISLIIDADKLRLFFIRLKKRS